MSKEKVRRQTQAEFLFLLKEKKNQSEWRQVRKILVTTFPAGSRVWEFIEPSWKFEVKFKCYCWVSASVRWRFPALFARSALAVWAHNDAALMHRHNRYATHQPTCPPPAQTAHLSRDITPPTLTLVPMTSPSLQPGSDWLPAPSLIKERRASHQRVVHHETAALWRGNKRFETHITEILIDRISQQIKNSSKRLQGAEPGCRASLHRLYLFSTDCFCTTIIALGSRENSGNWTGRWSTAEQPQQPMTRSWKQRARRRFSGNERRKHKQLSHFLLIVSGFSLF